jgi:hypothetical protein
LASMCVTGYLIAFLLCVLDINSRRFGSFAARGRRMFKFHLFPQLDGCIMSRLE